MEPNLIGVKSVITQGVEAPGCWQQWSISWPVKTHKRPSKEPEEGVLYPSGPSTVSTSAADMDNTASKRRVSRKLRL